MRKRNNTDVDIELTIVTLVFNSAATIARCLNSLKKQTVQNFRVLIVDNGCSDNTLEIVNDYKHSLNIKVVHTDRNSIALARNVGLNVSNTPLVAFLDSDDSAHIDYVENIYSRYRLDKSVAIISGNLVPRYSTRTTLAISMVDDTIKSIFGKGVLMFSSGSSIINKGIVKNVAYDEKFTYGEDIEYAHKISSRYKIINDPNIKIGYYSRASFKTYARQMYRYGQWKVYYAVRAREHRPIDYAPLILITISCVYAIWYMPACAAIVFFSLLETLFIVVYRKVPVTYWGGVYMVWLAKNISWSLGIIAALMRVLVDGAWRDYLLNGEVVSNE